MLALGLQNYFSMRQSYVLAFDLRKCPVRALQIAGFHPHCIGVILQVPYTQCWARIYMQDWVAGKGNLKLQLCASTDGDKTPIGTKPGCSNSKGHPVYTKCQGS